ncbi:MAG: hypothetical protein II874_09465 [Bacteroidales bacterium]|nr:hypothetical protein [Bacteroidales bacterium]
MTFADFILQHEADDPVRLLLSRDKYPDLDIDLAATTLEVRRKLRTKVPEWYAVPSLVYPSRLSGEQCSSSETARYKALVCGSSVVPAKERLRIADLTGGMGVDAWAFAKVAKEVLYNEMQEDLVRATELNFSELGVLNVRFRNCRVEPGKVREVLDGFQPDVIFLDPARRAGDGRKVFLIEECQPDVPGLLPELFETCRFVMLKLSPMADITMACKRLGTHVKEVHVVAAGGECKELLFLLDRDWEGTPATFIVESGAVMEISGQAGNDDAGMGFGLPKAGDCLFEPGKALAKAGAFRLPCSRFGLTKLGNHTHLYVGEAVPEGLNLFGKWFEVLEVLPLNNRTMKEAGKRWPQAEVTARNVPMTSDQLRRKLGCASGGDIHLFGVRADAAEAGNYLIVTRKRYGSD